MRVFIIFSDLQGVEDSAEPPEDLRAGWLSPEQGGPACCEREPLRHVHHPLGQGGDCCRGIIIVVNLCPAQVPSSTEDTSMADKEAILATLNIKAMTFDDTFSALPKSKYC